ncbi:MAG: methyltransferase [Polyangiaceae bacterium]
MDRWLPLTRLAHAHLDVIHERVERAVPSWATRRGWVDYLASLDEAALRECELHGAASFLLGDETCPDSLRRLASESLALCEIEPLDRVEHAPTQLERERKVRPRKQSQIEWFSQAITERFPSVHQVIDIGAGHGHLTRVVSDQLGVRAIALENNESRVTVGRALAGSRVSDLYTDAFDSPQAAQAFSTLDEHGLLIALHGCGALGDLVVQTAAQRRASVFLVGCCPQKIPSPARSLLAFSSGAELESCDVTIQREALGLANVLPREVGVERPMEDEIEARTARMALRLFLENRGVHHRPGAEMQGINRRRARQGADALIRHACQIRSFTPPSDAEIDAARHTAEIEIARDRRMALPRTMLGRVIEVLIAEDRAQYLRQNGYDVEVRTLFDVSISPRNIVVIGRAIRRGKKS